MSSIRCANALAPCNERTPPPAAALDLASANATSAVESMKVTSLRSTRTCAPGWARTASSSTFRADLAPMSSSPVKTTITHEESPVSWEGLGGEGSALSSRRVSSIGPLLSRDPATKTPRIPRERRQPRLEVATDVHATEVRGSRHRKWLRSGQHNPARGTSASLCMAAARGATPHPGGAATWRCNTEPGTSCSNIVKAPTWPARAPACRREIESHITRLPGPRTSGCACWLRRSFAARSLCKQRRYAYGPSEAVRASQTPTHLNASTHRAGRVTHMADCRGLDVQGKQATRGSASCPGRRGTNSAAHRSGRPTAPMARPGSRPCAQRRPPPGPAA